MDSPGSSNKRFYCAPFSVGLSFNPTFRTSMTPVQMTNWSLFKLAVKFTDYYNLFLALFIIYFGVVVSITVDLASAFYKFLSTGTIISATFFTSHTTQMVSCGLQKFSMRWAYYYNFFGNIFPINGFRVIVFTTVNCSRTGYKLLCS